MRRGGWPGSIRRCPPRSRGGDCPTPSTSSPTSPPTARPPGEVMAILRRNAETVEVVGLDEAYVDLTGLFSPKATMRRIAREIREETGLTCSIGISENRLLAKIASELGKPAGLVVLSREEALERFAEDPPGLVPGIGPKTAVKLQRMGIRTLAALRARDAACAEGGLRPAAGPLAAGPRSLRGRHAAHRRPRGEVAVGGDDLRHRRPRPRRAGRLAHLARRGALPAPALARPRGPHDRDQGPARRLDHRHPRPHGRAADQRPRGGRAGRARPARAPTPHRARCDCSASGSPPSGETIPHRRAPRRRTSSSLHLPTEVPRASAKIGL